MSAMVHLRSRGPRAIRSSLIVFALAATLCLLYNRRSATNLSSPFATHRGNAHSLVDVDSPDLDELGWDSPDVDPSETAPLVLDHRGLFEYDIVDRGEHPIRRLIRRGKELARVQEANLEAVTNLKGVVADYVAAFNMAPPLGIDAWYAFTRRPSPPSVHLPSLLPQAHSPFRMFLSLPGAEVRRRLDDLVNGTEGVWSLVFVPDGKGDMGTTYDIGETWEHWTSSPRGPGKFRMRGEHAWGHKANMTLRLILPMIPHLPEDVFTMDPPLELVFSIHDAPSGLVSHSFRSQSESLAAQGQTWSEKELVSAEAEMKKLRGLQWACDPESPLAQLRADPSSQGLDSSRMSKSFIGDFQKSADYCRNPDLLNLHNMYLNDPYWGNNPIRPLLATCRFAQNSDLLSIPMDNIFADPTPFLDWNSKTSDKLHWRGTPTGSSHHKDYAWRQGQRDRLQLLAQNTSSSPRTLLSYVSGTTVGLVDYPVGEMNERWLDVGLVPGAPGWCKESDGTCAEAEALFRFADRVPAEKLSQSKYLLDVDGNGWSSRFRRLLSGNNVVIKSTIFTEWYHEMLIPWYHYVPTQLDYSDLYDIMAFFTGDPAGVHPGHDDLAEEIALHGRQFEETKWREEDMQSYLFLLILEWRRMFADDRKQYSTHS